MKGYMRNRAITYYFLCVFSFLLVSCDSDKKDEVVPETEDEMAKCQVERQFSTFANSTSSYEKEFIYNATHKLSRVNETYNYAVPGKGYETLTYDAKGNVERVSHYSKDDRLEVHRTFEHNETGLLMKSIVYFPYIRDNVPEKILSYTNYVYNDKKQLISVKSFYADEPADLPAADITYTYDASGNVTNSIEYRVLAYQGSPDNFYDIVIKTQYTYDNKINPLKENAEMRYLLNSEIVPGLSQNNVESIRRETTLEGTQRGPGPNFNASAYNFYRTTTYTYNDKDRPVKAAYSDGAYTTYELRCE